jgi:hypothetical protein
VERGVVTLRDAVLAGPEGAITAEGDIDLPGNTSDLYLRFRPAVPDPPTLGMRLSGPWTAPRRALDLVAAAAWRAAHPLAPAPAATPAAAAPAGSPPATPPATGAPAGQKP